MERLMDTPLNPAQHAQSTPLDKRGLHRHNVAENPLAPAHVCIQVAKVASDICEALSAGFYAFGALDTDESGTINIEVVKC